MRHSHPSLPGLAPGGAPEAGTPTPDPSGVPSRLAAEAATARFNGPEYDAARDNVRLVGQLRRVYLVMCDGHWRTVAEIASLTGDPEPSVSAQLRHLRKRRFGGHTVDRRARAGALFEYRLLI